MPDSTGRPYHFELEAQQRAKESVSTSDSAAQPSPENPIPANPKPNTGVSPENNPPAPRLSKDGSRIGKRANNGGLPGTGIKKGTQLPTKRTYDPQALAEVVAQKIITGKPIAPTPKTGPISEDDRQLLARIAGESVETFNERSALQLREIAQLAASRIKEHLQADNFKPGELGFIYSVAHDKRLSLDGSRALQLSSVNLTVNNFGPRPKDSLLADLDGLSNAKPVSPLPISDISVSVDTIHSSPMGKKAS